MTTWYAIVGVVIASILGALGSFFFKKASAKLELSFTGLAFNKPLIVGFLLYGLSVSFFVASLKYGELSVLYPLASLSFIWITLLSMFFLGEKMNSLKWIGVALIMVGVSLIGFGSV